MPVPPGSRRALLLAAAALATPHVARAQAPLTAFAAGCAALLLVERGEAPLGIVYATDAQAARGVRVLARFPPESHPPITYPFALIRRAAGHAPARALLAFLTGPAAGETWRRFGFTQAG